MDCETMWRLFLATGLPEAYSLYAHLREGRRRAKPHNALLRSGPVNPLFAGPVRSERENIHTAW